MPRLFVVVYRLYDLFLMQDVETNDDARMKAINCILAGIFRNYSDNDMKIILKKLIESGIVIPVKILQQISKIMMEYQYDEHQSLLENNQGNYI